MGADEKGGRVEEEAVGTRGAAQEDEEPDEGRGEHGEPAEQVCLEGFPVAFQIKNAARWRVPARRLAGVVEPDLGQTLLGEGQPVGVLPFAEFLAKAETVVIPEKEAWVGEGVAGERRLVGEE